MRRGKVLPVILLGLAPLVLAAQFGPIIQISLPGTKAMRWGEWNSDSLLDLLLAYPNTSGSVELLLWTAGPDGLKQTHILPGTYTQVYSQDWDDMDRDGDVDLMVCGIQNGNTVFNVLRNDPEGFSELPVLMIFNNTPTLSANVAIINRVIIEMRDNIYHTVCQLQDISVCIL